MIFTISYDFFKPEWYAAERYYIVITSNILISPMLDMLQVTCKKPEFT